jgi:hypothetical protein
VHKLPKCPSFAKVRNVPIFPKKFEHKQYSKREIILIQVNLVKDQKKSANIYFQKATNNMANGKGQSAW